MAIEMTWRGEFTSDEADRLHADAFGVSMVDVADRDWRRLVEQHSLGWVTAREAGHSGKAAGLVGFVNVVWDGRTHAWLQDVMVAADRRRQGLGGRLVRAAPAQPAVNGSTSTSRKTFAASTWKRAASHQRARA